MERDYHYKECQGCGELLDLENKRCTKCGSEDLKVIDERTACAICEKKVDEDEMNTCERCGKEVCFDCIYDDYPYGTTLCQECGEEWKALMEKNNFTC